MQKTNEDARRKDDTVVIDLLTIIVVYFAVMAWGSNELWAIGLNAIFMIALFGARLIIYTWNSIKKPNWEQFYIIAIAFSAFIAVSSIKYTGNSNEDVSLAGSVAQYHTIIYLLLFLSCIAVTFLVHNGFRSRENLKIVIISVMVLGSFEGIYGLIQYLGDYNYIWNFRRQIYTALASGTLVNRNHYGLLVNLCICTGIGYLYYRSSRLLGGGRLSWRGIIGFPGAGKLMGIVFWVAIMGLGVIFSMSRMGIAAMIVGAGAMIVAGNRAETGKRATAIALLVVVVALGLAIYIGVDAVLARYEEISKERESDKDRIALWRDAWKMVEKHPWFGQGLGSFQWTFPEYETVDPDTPARYAHNDYLQALAEVGIVGLALLLWAYGCVWRVAIKNLRHPKDPLVRGIGLGTIGALTVIALQEFTDFGLYIPGVAMLAAVLVGLNLRAQSLGQEMLTADLHGSSRIKI